MSYVPPSGPKDAKIVIVGEAPGSQEAKLGKPFVGRSGKLLGHLLNGGGILRDNCYVTNVVKEKPYKNNIKPYIDVSKKHASVSEKGQNYLQILKKELSQLNPNVIVAVGNIALYALTGKKGITKWRGSVLESYTGHKVIPIIHPAAALRQYNIRYLILHDLKRVRDHSTYPEMPEDNREYLIPGSFEEAYEFLNVCLTKPRVAFDIEVGTWRDKEVSCISFAYNDTIAMSIPFVVDGMKQYWLPEQEQWIWLKIAELLETPKVEKVAHNASFDVTFLFRKYGIRTKNIIDTMVAEGIIHPDFRKGLAYVTAWYTSMAYYKDEGKSEFKSQSNEQFFVYNAKDSLALMEALPKQIQELDRQGNLETFYSQCELIRPLTYMSARGMRIDHERLEGSRDKVDFRIKELRVLINSVVGYDLNPNSPQQLMEFFYELEGHPPYKSRTTGRPTTDEKALKRLARKTEKRWERVSKVANYLLEIRKLSKLKGTYLDVKLGREDRRLRGSFNPIGTTTLRLSSSADIFGVGTNLQNLPPRMKENIIPDEGYVMFEIDLAQAENRIVAYIAPEPKMISAFETGEDIHSKTAGMLFEMDPVEVKRLYKEYYEHGQPSDPKYCPSIGQGNKPFRYWGKEANHAFNYGLGYKSAALRWEIPEKDAKFIYNRYHSIYPGVRQMHRWIDNKLRKSRRVENLFGYSRTFLGRWNEASEKAYAFVAQSTIGELINRRGIKYIYYRPDLFPEVELLNQIHDSVVFQIPLSVGWEKITHQIEMICANLEQPLCFRGREFSIPAEVTVIGGTFTEGVEIDHVSREALENAYKESVNNLPILETS